MSKKAIAVLSGLVLTGALLMPTAGPAVAGPAAEPVATKAVPSGATTTLTAKTLQVDFQYQETGYWCGPAATRIALSARVTPPSQQQLANELPTTTNGTDWIGQVTRVLNNRVGTGWYETKEMPNDPPTQAQRDLLWNDIVLDIDNNYPIVANIVAPAGNHPPGYPNYTIYHYFTVIGYDSADMTVLIADPAGFAPTATYWLTFNQLATLIPPKGYAA
ncbi:C39 family peptidase [Kribbella sp. DT2]|uniref:C39 family peptidase n=1 Tax=Kribbella sp. DT2 TaxID=3393427 RepID=UPI003CEBF358